MGRAEKWWDVLRRRTREGSGRKARMWSWISGGRVESERWWGGMVMGEEGMAGCGYVESMFLKLCVEV